MKIALLLTVPLAKASCPYTRRLSDETQAFKPLKLSLDDLVNDASPQDFEHALSASGIVAVDLNGDFTSIREQSLYSAQECIQERSAPASEYFQDGTRRLSIATSIEPGFQAKDLNDCANVDQKFRERIHEATKLFASRLGEVYDLGNAAKPLLSTKDSLANYQKVSDVLEHGEHLEHFHSYHKDKGANNALIEATSTIPFHTDQGLFIAFVPPENVDTNGNAVPPLAEFWIELPSGKKVQIEIEDQAYRSSVFFLLGDGVEQYINPLLGGSGPPLRSCPHSLKMTTTADDVYRVWYGLMVLPPSDAISTTHGIEYGRLRELAIENAAADNDAIASMGCSRNLYARELAETSCASDELFCWARCMPLYDHYGAAVSAEICQEQGFSNFTCIDPSRQVSDGTTHGDYYPGCTDFEFPATEPPTIAPADEDQCTDAFSTAVAKAEDEHFGMVAFEYSGPRWAPIDPPLFYGYMFWTVIDDVTSKSGKALKIRMMYPGRFGWFSMGVVNEGGGHNGMNGASVIMAIPGRTDASEVESYTIDDDASAFRWWSTPIETSDIADTSLSQRSDHCVTEFAFTISELTADVAFDPTDGKCHQLLWGISTDTLYEYDPLFLHGGYHEGRGFVDVDFTVADGTCVVLPDENEEEQNGSSKKSNSSKTEVIVIIVVIVVVLFALGLIAFYTVTKSKGKNQAVEFVQVEKGTEVSNKEESKDAI